VLFLTDEAMMPAEKRMARAVDLFSMLEGKNFIVPVRVHNVR
jgi:hypothetical protein